MDVKERGGGGDMEKGPAACSVETNDARTGEVITRYLCGNRSHAQALEILQALEKEVRHVLGLKNIA